MLTAKDTVEDKIDGLDIGNVVSVYIHYLRNKIDKGFEKKLIHTVRTIGYVMRDDKDD
jgi:DNA-binding response OmpR family regulator